MIHSVPKPWPSRRGFAVFVQVRGVGGRDVGWLPGGFRPRRGVM